jgi:hypothetical protein
VFLRRLFFTWQFIAVIVLPAWLFVGWGVFGGSGWGFLGLLIAGPAVFLALGAVALITFARPAVRRTRAVSWIDVATLVVWHAMVVGIGFFGSTATLFTVLAILAGIAAFWLAIWQLLTDGARHVRATLEEFERQAGQAPPVSRHGRRLDDGEVIVVRESDE